MDIVTKFEQYESFDLAMVLRIGTHTLILNRFPTVLIGKTNSKWSLQIFNFDKTKITLHQKIMLLIHICVGNLPHRIDVNTT